MYFQIIGKHQGKYDTFHLEKTKPGRDFEPISEATIRPERSPKRFAVL